MTVELNTWRPGCFCGCGDRDECLAGGPAPDTDACCGQLDHDQINEAVKRGWHCASPGGCVAKRLKETT